MDDLEELMKCPVEWAQETGDDDWYRSLPLLDWEYCLASHAVDSSALPHDPWDYEWLCESPRELEWLANLRERRQVAEEMYSQRAARLHGVSFLTPSQHGKHFVAGIGRDGAVRLSKMGRSLFWEDYSSARLKGAFWFWFQMYFDTVLCWSTIWNS